MAKFSSEVKEAVLEIWDEVSTVAEAARLLYPIYNPTGNREDIDNLRRSISKFLYDERIKVKDDIPETSEEYAEAKKRELKDSKYYLVTWEQNNTPIHEGLWKNIIAYKDFLGAELSVILGRYKNPTSIFTDKKDEIWNEKTRPYWDAKRHDIHNYVSIISDIKIQPTKKNPLTRIKDLSRNKSVIVGHPTLHLKPEPILNGYPHQVLATTGAITMENYTDSLAGGVAEANHKLGFAIIELKDEEVFFIRQVEAKPDGSFVDLCHSVKNGVVKRVDKAMALVIEPHYPAIDPEIDKLNDEICEAFDVDYLVMHDVIDGESCNNHLKNQPIEQVLRFQRGEWSMEKELDGMGDWLETKLKYNPVIIRSNHNDRFDRILNEDWRKDIPNSLFLLEYTLKTASGEVGTEGVVNYYLNKRFGEKIKTLDYTDSFLISKYEMSQHGHVGANGSRGSLVSFRNLGIPSILGHSHSPHRMNDCIYIGTNTPLRMGYNRKGMSSWMTTNVLITSNGLAQQLFIIKGEYTTFDI